MTSLSRLWPGVLLASLASWHAATAEGATAPEADDAEAAGEPEPPRAEDSLTTTDFQPREPGFTLHWDLLRLPEFGARLALTPLFPILAAGEQVRLDLRIYDAVTNDERTSIVLPLITAYTKDGVGGGLLYSHSDAFGGGENIEFFALTTTNRDVNVSGSYSEDVSLLNGRSIGIGFDYDLDNNDRYYGLGPHTEPEDLRALETRSLELLLEFDIGGPNTFFRTGLGSELRLGYLRERLGPGKISGHPPVRDDDPEVPAPPGFEEPLDYANAEWVFSYDQRDSAGRTQRGVFLATLLSASTDMNSRDIHGGKTTVTATYFLPVAPRYRVLVFTVAGAAVTPLGEDAEVPLHQLVELGRSSSLRGYPKRRFRDRTGWWANLEYRYPIFDYQDTGAGLSAAMFIDAGAVAPSVLKFGESKVRYSPGIGIRAEAPSDFVFRAQVAWSPEGIEAGISLNELYDLL